MERIDMSYLQVTKLVYSFVVVCESKQIYLIYGKHKEQQTREIAYT